MKQQTRNKSVKERFYKFMEGLTPPGIDVGKELRAFFGGLAGAWILSLRFFQIFSIAIARLYHDPKIKKILIEGAVMTDFSVILDDCLISFNVLGVYFLGVVVWRYLYYRQGSKSIYLMKRLPDRWEIHKRAWILPLLAVAATLAAAFVVMLLYFGFYMLATPKQCIAPGQWQKIWR